MRVRPALLPSLLFLSTLAALAAGCANPPAPPSSGGPAVAVAMVQAASADWPAHFEAGGVLRAVTTASISSRLPATVTSVRVHPGDRVRRGQVLVELDGASLVASADRAAAGVKAASEGATAAAAELESAEAALTLAKVTHTRIAELAANRAATAQELDQAVAALAAAESRVRAAQARRSEAAAGLEGAVAGQRGSDHEASYRFLTAPFDGVIVDRAIDPGSMAMPGAPLLVLESAGALQLELRLDASRAAAVAVGQHVDVHVDTDSADAPARDGQVVEVSHIDAEAHSFGVKISLASPGPWRSGLFGRARFAGASRRVVSIPASAVVLRGQLSFVFTAVDGRARLRAVSLGDSVGTEREVLDGLSAGEAVLLAPPPSLTDGTAIAVSGGAR